ncbi:ABC transporter ATP-binding protein [Desulfospira joergensenii]|uniref:ABC transporter ATP-binding protein n=1 Tax=Desulfospira joergensenii TaxID=53329 RepID=UPI0003B6489E|nr:ATP-binding cassette domain-containing protein [Desulfospira joergensenii]
MENNIFLQLKEVSKRFGQVDALKSVSFSARQGEFLSILGPSGCGKTTALRVVAGLEIQDSGNVFINNTDVSSLGVSKRNVGIVFQSYALFPNLNAAKNIAYGLKGQASRQEITQKVEDLMDLVGLAGMGQKYPAQLSGGQQQRVALARAMALSPDLLLLDEPLSALDAKVRIKLRSEIRRLQQHLGVTTIMVTHDQEEALTMADRILVMNEGKLVQKGSPHQIYEQPATPFVASFIGSMNFMGKARKMEPGMYDICGRSFYVANENGTARLLNGDQATLAIRPEDVMIDSSEKQGQNLFPGRIETMEYRGSLFRLNLRLSTGGKIPVITADLPTEQIRRFSLQQDMPVTISLPPERLLVYEASPGERIHG